MSDGEHGVVPPDFENRLHSVAAPMDPRLPILAQMAASIYAEKIILMAGRERSARRESVDEAFLLYGEIAIRLGRNDA